MITLNRAIIQEKLKQGDPDYDLKQLLKKRAIDLATYLVDSDLVEEYHQLSELTLDYMFYSHIVGGTFVDCKLSSQVVKDCNFTRLETPSSVGAYCYDTLFNKVFTPIVNGHLNYNSQSVYYFSLRSKLLNLKLLEYDLDNWADEYTIIKFTINNNTDYINVVLSANDGTIEVFKDKYKDYIRYTSRPHRQDYYEEVLRALGNKDVNTYKPNSFREPWLSDTPLDYEREVLRSKNWIDCFNNSIKATRKNMEPIWEKLGISEEQLFDSFFWSTIPESYVQTYGKLK